MKTVAAGLFATLVVLTPLVSAAGNDGISYRVLATSKTSTMEKEMNEAGDTGYQFASVMGGESAAGGKEVIVVLSKPAATPVTEKRSFRLLATSKTSTMEKEMQKLGDDGYQYQGQTVFASAFGGKEVVVIMERNPGATGRTAQYRLLATKRTSTMQTEMQEAGDQGFQLVGMTISHTAVGGSEMICILAKVSK